MSDNEQETRETVADIVAVMRRGLDKSWHEINREWLHGLPDRIEAAAKREREAVEADALSVGGVVEAARAAEKSSAVGNAAAMRKAPETILRYVAPICRYAKPDGEQPTALFAIADTVRDIVAKALSAPPRNCDRFADAESARKAWLDDAENWDEFGSPKLWLHEWLLAPAKKGGAE